MIEPGARFRKVISDLSFSHVTSVNDDIAKDTYPDLEFILTLLRTDYINSKEKHLGKDFLLYKINISRVFRHKKLNPAHYSLLGLFPNKYCIDTCLPFC